MKFRYYCIITLILLTIFVVYHHTRVLVLLKQNHTLTNDNVELQVDNQACGVALYDITLEYEKLFFEYKTMSAEISRLEELTTPKQEIGEAWSYTVPYEVPVDIQEPLPYVYE